MGWGGGGVKVTKGVREWDGREDGTRLEGEGAYLAHLQEDW